MNAIQTDKGLVLIHEGDVFTVPNDHANFSGIVEAINRQDAKEALRLVNLTQTIKDWLSDAKKDGFDLRDGLLFLDDSAFTQEVTDKVLRMIKGGLDAAPLLKFLKKLRRNPSAIAQREALLFAAANQFAIHDDGDVIAFKGVRGDYKDTHSGSLDNSVGKVVEMPRHEVDDRREVTCSFGLHFGSLSQANGYGQRTMVLKIDPADIVSIPKDYSNQKGRCCRYLVFAELKTRQLAELKEVYEDSDFLAEDEEQQATPVSADADAGDDGQYI